MIDIKVLVTGNLGYIGSVLTKYLMERKIEVVGLDNGFFKDFSYVPRKKVGKQIIKDIRKIQKDDINGMDAIIHLAAISNDPIGELNPKITYDVNHKASIKLAKIAKNIGIERFIFSSSCSVYGSYKGGDFLTEDSELGPITAYAKSKVLAEKDLSKLTDTNFAPIILRNATVYGVSPRMRFDLVVNNMTGHLFTKGYIEMKSNGKPWRPNVHIKDVCEAFYKCLITPINEIKNQILNVGANSENYRVKEIADIIASVKKGAKVNCLNLNPKDARSYRVDFSKISNILNYKTKMTVKDGASEVFQSLEKKQINEFDIAPYITLKQIKKLMNEKKINENLEWTD
ncbi:MAG: SDR family oxidoreductase [Candidatus Helarchaeota archaeon]